MSASAVVRGPALDRLGELTGQCGVSEAAVLLALWRSLYGRYCRDADDRCWCWPTAGPPKALTNVLGLLERPVPVRLAIGADTPVADALQASKDALRSVAAIENQMDPGTAASAHRAADGCPLSFQHRRDRWAEELWAGAPATKRRVRCTSTACAGRGACA